LNSAEALQKKKYIVLDRDGTLIQLVPYLKDPELVDFVPEIANVLATLKELGFRFGIISNQSVIGRGKANLQEVKNVNRKITDFFEKIDVHFDFFLFCPHTPEDFCLCRKPNTLLGETAIKEYSIDPGKSFMIGDAISDMEFGNRLGLTSILISSEFPSGESSIKYLWAQDMIAAVLVIKGEEVKKIHE
jgi:HAD superfamily hydrolase (TIGR01662 family)